MALFACAPLQFVAASLAAESGRMAIAKIDRGYRVTVDGQLFAEIVEQGYAKPIVYPIMGPDQVPMTRNFPMVQGVAGEPADHPHHKSLWFAHGRVNDDDFWLEHGRIEPVRTLEVQNDPRRAAVTTEHRWVGREKNTVCTDATTVAFFAIPAGRVIDYDVTIHASNGDVTFGDTKEGTMALRVHPNLQLTPPKESPAARPAAHAVNSRGQTGKAVWGQRAEWVDYHGQIDGHKVGIAFFDHPKNPRHPTYWHARDYGLFAANPFGASSFTGKQQPGGAMRIPAGQSIRLRYRVVLHRGDERAAHIAELYKQYAQAGPGS